MMMHSFLYMLNVHVLPGTESSTKWADGTEDHVVGECKYDFVGERPDELTVTAGQRINLAPAGK